MSKSSNVRPEITAAIKKALRLGHARAVYADDGTIIGYQTTDEGGRTSQSSMGRTTMNPDSPEMQVWIESVYLAHFAFCRLSTPEQQSLFETWAMKGLEGHVRQYAASVQYFKEHGIPFEPGNTPTLPELMQEALGRTRETIYQQLDI